MLLGLPFDEDKLIAETPDEDGLGFNQLASPLARFSASGMALILPLDAQGALVDVADAFLEGFIAAAEEGGEVFSLEIYRTDGEVASELKAYRQAIADGAGIIVGPLLRTSVARIAGLAGRINVPTILLQDTGQRTFAGQAGAPLLYSFPLGAEPEIIQFATLAIGLANQREVYVLAEDSPLGARLVPTFQRIWRERGARPLNVRQIVSPEVWVEIHNELREFLITGEERLEALKEEGVEVELPPAEELEPQPLPPAVFAAGGSEFISQVRANVPSALPVYTLAAVEADLAKSGRNTLGLDGIRLFQLPYLLKLELRDSELVGGPYARSLPPDLQRYFVFGLDAYAIAYAYPSWGPTDFWAHEGASGNIVLDNGVFAREGVPLEIVSGVVTRLSVAAPDEVSACIDDLAKCGLE